MHVWIRKLQLQAFFNFSFPIPQVFSPISFEIYLNCNILLVVRPLSTLQVEVLKFPRRFLFFREHVRRRSSGSIEVHRTVFRRRDGLRIHSKISSSFLTRVLCTDDVRVKQDSLLFDSRESRRTSQENRRSARLLSFKRVGDFSAFWDDGGMHRNNIYKPSDPRRK